MEFTVQGQVQAVVRDWSKDSQQHLTWAYGEGGHGLPKVSLGPNMHYTSTPCEQATPETALQPFHGWPAYRTGGLWPSSTPLDMPYTYGISLGNKNDNHDTNSPKMKIFVECENILVKPGHKNTFFNVNYEDKIFQIVTKTSIILLFI
jgi:hypothetical protein